MTVDPPQYGSKRQRETYRRRQSPEHPASHEHPVERAREELDEEAFASVAADAGSESTVAANDRAFEARRAVPRIPRDVFERDRSTDPFGRTLPAPVALAAAVRPGRPDAEAEGVGGEDGVRGAFEDFLADLDLTVGPSGCDRTADVDRSTIVGSDRR